jgi:hypothetical protein
MCASAGERSLELGAALGRLARDDRGNVSLRRSELALDSAHTAERAIGEERRRLDEHRHGDTGGSDCAIA